MKKYAPFFIVFLLLSAIPAIFLFLFPNAASNVNSGDIPTFGLGSAKKEYTQIEKQASHYLIRLKPSRSPLRQGPQTFRLEILNRGTGSHWAGSPELRISTAAETGAMTAPVQVTPLGKTGFYEVKTDFQTSGQWTVLLDLQRPQEQVELSLYIPAS